MTEGRTYPAAKPKVLLLIPNLDFGGAQRVFHGHSVMLAEHYAVTEAVFNLDSGHAFPSGNELVDLNVPGGGGWGAKLRNFIGRARRLRQLKERRKFVVSISHLAGADFINVLSRRKHEKLVLVVHGSRLHDRELKGLSGWLQNRLLLPLLYRRADRIVTVSREIADELVTMGVPRDRITTIYNFFDPAAVRARAAEALTKEEETIFGNKPVLVTSGRLAPQKNQAPLLALFAEVIKRTNAKLLLIGDGSLRDEMIEKSRKLGLATYDAWSGMPMHSNYDVYFVGFRDNPFNLIKSSDLFLLTSSWEGLPMVIGETMACGLPILSTDCATGPREFMALDHKRPDPPLNHAELADYGVLLPLLDGSVPLEQAIGVWSDTVARLLNDPLMREKLSVASMRRVDDFAADRIAMCWVELIDGLIAE